MTSYRITVASTILLGSALVAGAPLAAAKSSVELHGPTHVRPGQHFTVTVMGGDDGSVPFRLCVDKKITRHGHTPRWVPQACTRVDAANEYLATTRTVQIAPKHSGQVQYAPARYNLRTGKLTTLGTVLTVHVSSRHGHA